MLSFFLNPLFLKINLSQVLHSVPNMGNKKISFVCKHLGLLKTTKWSLLTDKQVFKIAAWLEERFSNRHSVGSVFIKNKQEYIKFLKGLKNYRSIRLARNLPARGQRTSTNARTVRRIQYLKIDLCC